MTTLGQERLLQLADFLDVLPEDHFDFTKYTAMADIEYSDVASKMFEDMECGTTACALGWMPKAFGDESPLVWDSNGDITGRDWVDDIDSAPEKFFGINAKERRFLFYPCDDDYDRMPESSTAAEVAAHLRRFVADGGIYELEE